MNQKVKPNNIERLAQEYRELRAKQQELEAATTLAVNDIKAKMEKIEIDMLLECSKTGVTSFKTKYGTFYQSTDTHVRIIDRQAFLDFIIEHNRRDMLTASCNKVAATQHLADFKQPPPGVNIESEKVIRFRKGDS